LEGKNQRNFKKDNDREKAKVPKIKKHRNELAHFCVFGFGGQGTVGAAVGFKLIPLHLLPCKLRLYPLPESFWGAGVFFQKYPASFPIFSPR